MLSDPSSSRQPASTMEENDEILITTSNITSEAMEIGSNGSTSNHDDQDNEEKKNDGYLNVIGAVAGDNLKSNEPVEDISVYSNDLIAPIPPQMLIKDPEVSTEQDTMMNLLQHIENTENDSVHLKKGNGNGNHDPDKAVGIQKNNQTSNSSELTPTPIFEVIDDDSNECINTEAQNDFSEEKDDSVDGDPIKSASEIYLTQIDDMIEKSESSEAQQQGENKEETKYLDIDTDHVNDNISSKSDGDNHQVLPPLPLKESEAVTDFVSTSGVKDEEHEKILREHQNSGQDRIRQLEDDLSKAVAKIIALTEERDMFKSSFNANIKKEASTNNVGADIKNDEYEQMLQDLQENLQKQMTVRAEAEYKLKQTETKLLDLQGQHETTKSEKSRLESEISKLRVLQQQSESKETISTNRINEAKKKESLLSHENARLEKSNTTLTEENVTLSTSLNEIKAQKDKLDSTLTKLKSKCVERVKVAEQNLQDERALNEERKKKMKVFVEAKANELRIAKQHKDEYFHELNECRTKLKKTREQLQEQIDLVRLKDSRISDVHGQLSRFKRDTERYLKMGDTLNQELDKSMQETEEHKSKRHLAKNELMSVLKKLELEQSVSGKLRDALKFTFTPKALSQQQLLQEGIESMEIQIAALAKKMGQPLPSSSADVIEYLHPSRSSNSENASSNGKGTSLTKNKLENDANRLVSNLEQETQRVSQGIMALQSSLERLHFLISGDGDRTCWSTISDFIAQYKHVYTQQQQHEQENDGEEMCWDARSNRNEII